MGTEEGPTDVSQATYVRLLEDFGANGKPARECVRFLESMGYSKGQARNAVYRYRLARGLTTSQ